MNRFFRATFGMAALLSAAGCAVAIDPGPGRAEVARSVSDRTGQEIRTDLADGEDAVVTARIRELLGQGVTVDEAVQITLLHNRELHALYTELDVAQADLVQASLLHNPVVDAAAGFPVGGGMVDFSFSVAMDVIDLVYVPLRKRVATARLEETKLRVASEVLDFTWRAQTAAYRHQADTQTLDLRRQVAESTGAAAELARRMREAGNITELELASEAALAEESKLELRLAEISARESHEELNSLMGLWGEEAGSWAIATSRLPDPPEKPFDTERIETRAIERNLELAAAEKLVVAAAETLGLDRASALFPEVTVGGIGERDSSEWEPGPTLSLPVPIFDRGQARIARAKAELRAAREIHHALAVRIRAAARRTRDRVIGHAERARHYRSVDLPLRDRVVQQSQLQYTAMQIGPIELLRAKEQQIEAGTRYVDALREYWMARADLGLIIAGRLPQAERPMQAPALEQMPRMPFPTL